MVDTVKSAPGAFPHVKWYDLEGDGVLTECAVVKEDSQGNVYFFELSTLDNIDKQRLFKILTNRNANKYELWDLLDQVTLGNGMNALVYFHQLVKVLTPSGKVIKPRQGYSGAALGKFDTNEPTVDSPNGRGN